MRGLAPLLGREAIRPRAIYQTHKWFARRLGTAFRAILVGTETTTEREFWRAFYRGNASCSRVLLDPFVGGGTSVIEGHRLGYRAFGVDIDPAAAAITRFESSLATLPELDAELARVKTEMRKRMAPHYGCAPDWTGKIPLHFFWVQKAPCPHCRAVVECHPHYRLAMDKERKIQWVYDPTRTTVSELPLSRKRILGVGSIESGPSKGGVLACPSCKKRTQLIDLTDKNGSIPEWSLFAVEEVSNPVDGRASPNTERHFRAATKTDQKCLQGIKAALASPSLQAFIPEDEIPIFPSGDNRLRNYGYRKFRQLFNPRQLLHLANLAQVISEQEDRFKTSFAIAFSDHLTTNCMMTHYAFAWRRLAPLFSIRAYRHITRPVEINPWMDGTGRGTYPNAVNSISRAKAFLLAPQEPAKDNKFTSVSYNVAEAKKAPIEIFAHDSRSLHFIPDKSVDIVLSDPPYFDNIAYGELSAFFKPWMRVVGLLESNANSVNENTLGVGKVGVEKTATFEVGLADCFKEANRALKDDGRVIFTFQNSKAEAWASLATALVSANLEVLATFPMLGDRPQGLHKKAGSSSWDAVLVCKKWDRSHVQKPSKKLCSKDADREYRKRLTLLSEVLSDRLTEADKTNLLRACKVAAITRASTWATI